MSDLQTASWDNTNVYLNLNDPKIEADIEVILKVQATLDARKNHFADLIPKIEKNDFTDLYASAEELKDLYRLTLDTDIIFYTIFTYASTSVSVNTTDNVAKALLSRMTKLSVNFTNAFRPMQTCLLKAPADFIEQFIQDERTKEIAFILSKERKRIDHLLNMNEETLITTFSVDGITAWGKLYDNISGAMKVQIDGEELGLAKANSLFSNKDRDKREKAYRAVNAGWRQNEISACAILNSINGWRNENFKLRSTKKTLHYLDQTCTANHISRETLDSMMNAVNQKKSLGQDIIRQMALEMNVGKMGPWDLLAPAPYLSTEEKISYPDCIKIIKAAFSEVSPEMADFAQMMMDKKWIDCAPSENRAQGAYCTGFARTNEPRVFMTYSGSMKNVVTMAHEIGHAYHSWVMNDLPFSECFYPSTLAETASIFAETTVRDYLLRHSNSKEEIKSILWQEIQSAQGLLINISARYEFEKNFVEARQEKYVSVEDTKDLMVAAQKTWYGDTLSEYDEMFWASKLHFSMSGRSFYNYPYLFGYLFSLSIYAKKDVMGADFHSRYVELLKDTGRMNVAELVKKHFNEDVTRPEYWLKSLAIVEETFNKFKAL